jgi:lipopolysaccharide biosynthesis glycosyltransferase
MIKNIACGIDDKYAKPLVTMLNSLFKHNKACTYNIFVLSLNVSDENKKQISTWIHQKGHNIHYIDIKKATLEKFPLKETETISKATYLRLFIPELLPQNINKVLYLDVDIIINKNLTELYDSNIEHFALAAIEDAPNSSIIAQEISPTPYFNAGVLLLNLNYLRDIHFTTQALQFIQANHNKIIFHDQDVLNAMLHDKCLLLPIQWNALGCFFLNPPIIQKSRISQLQQALNDPAVIHFSGSIKPWHLGCQHPLKRLYSENVPKIKTYHNISKYEMLCTFPRYQQLLFIIHCPNRLTKAIDYIATKTWKYLAKRKHQKTL